MSDDRAYEPPKLTEHGKLAEVTQTSPPDALDSTLGPGERGIDVAEFGPDEDPADA
jgi:hypothetical protein